MLTNVAQGARRRARTLGAGPLVAPLVAALVAVAFLAVTCIVARDRSHTETPATLLAAPVAEPGREGGFDAFVRRRGTWDSIGGRVLTPEAQNFRAARQVASRFCACMERLRVSHVVARCCGPGAGRLSLLTVCPTPLQAFDRAQLQLHGLLSPAWQTEAAQPAEAAQPVQRLLQRSALVASVTKAIDQRLTEDKLAAAVLKRLATDEARLVSAQCLATLLMNKLDQAL